MTQANNGYLPDKPTFGIKPTALDPSRAPEGGGSMDPNARVASSVKGGFCW